MAGAIFRQQYAVNAEGRTPPVAWPPARGFPVRHDEANGHAALIGHGNSPDEFDRAFVGPLNIKAVNKHRIYDLRLNKRALGFGNFLIMPAFGGAVTLAGSAHGFGPRSWAFFATRFRGTK
jgi:hypothetical protein